MESKPTETLEFIRAPDGEKLLVIRPDDPAMALMMVDIALQKQDNALLSRLHEEVGDYKFMGFLAKIDGQFRIVNEHGKSLGNLEPGDSFITAPDGQRPS